MFGTGATRRHLVVWCLSGALQKLFVEFLLVGWREFGKVKKCTVIVCPAVTSPQSLFIKGRLVRWDGAMVGETHDALESDSEA